MDITTLLKIAIGSVQLKHTAILKMGRTSFLNYYKTILEKVSFDAKLIEKEYRKAKQFLPDAEKRELDRWLETTGLIQKFTPLETGEKAAGQLLEKRLQVATPTIPEISA